MGKLKIWDNVNVIIDSQLKQGTIIDIINDSNMAIVKLNDGQIVKVKLSLITKVQEPPKPVEKSEITITPDEFRDISTRIIVEETDRLPVALLVGNVVAKIHEKLFLDKTE